MLGRLRHPTLELAQKLNLIGDLTILVVAAIVATLDGRTPRWSFAMALAAAAVTLWLMTSRVLGHYDVRSGRGLWGDVALTIVLLSSVTASLVLLGRAEPACAAATHFASFVAIVTPAVLWLRVRLTGLRLWRLRDRDGVVVVGTGPLGRLTARDLIAEAERRHLVLLGHLTFADHLPTERLHAPVLGAVGDLEAVLGRLAIDEVYFASSATAHHDEVQAAIRTCEKYGIPFALPAAPYRLARAKPSFPRAIADGYVHFVTVEHKPVQRLLKRAFDIALSGVALVVLSPLLAVVAIAIKLGSRGPVLFRQERVGLHGRTFDMLKFRSMVENAEALKQSLLAQNEQSGPVFKIKDDPRITPIGRLIRKVSIDELPQLLNVLRGDMSIVGPRPPLPSEVARYEAWQHRRLSVRPGITCVWQVSGRNEISFHDWMLLDMRYIDHWSLFEDFKLILETVPVVINGRGAS